MRPAGQVHEAASFEAGVHCALSYYFVVPVCVCVHYYPFRICCPCFCPTTVWSPATPTFSIVFLLRWAFWAVKSRVRKVFGACLQRKFPFCFLRNWISCGLRIFSFVFSFLLSQIGFTLRFKFHNYLGVCAATFWQRLPNVSVSVFVSVFVSPLCIRFSKIQNQFIVVGLRSALLLLVVVVAVVNQVLDSIINISVRFCSLWQLGAWHCRRQGLQSIELFKHPQKLSTFVCQNVLFLAFRVSPCDEQTYCRERQQQKQPNECHGHQCQRNLVH